MYSKKDVSVFINGQEIKSISEENLQYVEGGIGRKPDVITRDCKIDTTYGCIEFTAVFTLEQWAKFIEVSEMTKQAKTEGTD